MNADGLMARRQGACAGNAYLRSSAFICGLNSSLRLRVSAVQLIIVDAAARRAGFENP
jgi:hypothetical protein